jgi:hypothetical protein
MALIKNDCKGVERFEHESNDCTVRALANATGMPYKLAHRIMAQRASRKVGKGVMASDWHPVYESFGVKLQSIHGSTNGALYLAHLTGKARQAGITLERLLPRLGSGRYIIKVRGHVLAVVDGKVLDYGYNPAGCRVQAVYKASQSVVSFDK